MKKLIQTTLCTNLVVFMLVLAGCGRDTSQQAAQAYVAPQTNQIAATDDISAEEILAFKKKPAPKVWTCTATCRNCADHTPIYGTAKTSVAAGNKAMNICRAQYPSGTLCLVVSNSCFKH